MKVGKWNWNKTHSFEGTKKKVNLVGEVQRIRIIAPGKSTLFLKGRIANRFGSSIDSAMCYVRERERELNNGLVEGEMRLRGFSILSKWNRNWFELAFYLEYVCIIIVLTWKFRFITRNVLLQFLWLLSKRINLFWIQLLSFPLLWSCSAIVQTVPNSDSTMQMTGMTRSLLLISY